MPKISVSKSIKAGVGKYESVDFNVSYELEVPDTKVSTTDAAYKHAFGIVDAQLNKQLEETQGILKSDSVFLMESKPKSTRR